MEDQSYEDYKRPKVRGHKPGRTLRLNAATVAAGLAVLVVVGGLAFAGGMHYQKHHAASRSGMMAGNFDGYGAYGSGGRGGMGVARAGGLGDVTAVSDSSITVKSERSGTTKTYTVSSDTTITNDGASAKLSDIKVGDTVRVRTSGSSSDAATTIVINPSFGQGGGGQQGDTQSVQSNSTI